MNWVGGARSRLKVPNERKLQKEYFEKQRLATRLSRGQPFNQLKAPISKDLLFLSKAAAADDHNKSPIRAVPNRVNLDSAGKHFRDIELPMSPIEKPSTLELMDTTVASVDQSFYQPRLNTSSLPRVSTMKLPQGPTIREFELSLKHGKRKANPSAIDVDYTTEAQFPVANLSKEPSNHQPTDKRRVANKKFSLDHLLNASQIKDTFLCKPKKIKRQEGSKFVAKHADQMLWSGLFGESSITKGSLLSIDEKETLTKSRATKQKGLGYNFGEWAAHVKKPVKHDSKLELVKDKDAMLEIHYAPDESPKTTHHTHQEKDQQLPVILHHNHGKPNLDPKNPRLKQDNPSWLSHFSLLLTENPFSDHHQPSKPMRRESPCPEKTSHLDMGIHEESIFAPLKKRRLENKEPEKISQASMLDESIFGPLKKKNRKEGNRAKQTQSPVQEHASTSINLHNEGPIRKSGGEGDREEIKKNQVKRLTAFEKMMSSFENNQGGCKENDVEDVIVAVQEALQTEKMENIPENLKKRHSQWKNFVSGYNLLSKDKSQSESDQSQLLLPKLKTRKTMNCSALEELMCLEQEVLNPCTQELTLSPIDCTEDPIERKVPDVNEKLAQKILYLFESSQESSISTKLYLDLECHREDQTSVASSLVCSQELSLSSKDQDKATDVAVCDPAIEDNGIELFVANNVTIEAETEGGSSPLVNKPPDAYNVKSLPNNEEHFGCKLDTQDTCKLTNIIPSQSSVKLSVSSSTQTSPLICPTKTQKEQQTTPPSIKINRSTSPMELAQSTVKATLDSVTLSKDASTQARIGSSEISNLSQEVKRLRNELRIAENTIVWQSLMMRIQNI